MWQADREDRTISSVKSGHLTSVICGQPTSVLTAFNRLASDTVMPPNLLRQR